MERQPCVYILTNRRNGTLYTGVTANLPRRIWEHKQKCIEGFSKRYNLNKLVWFELHGEMRSAIQREKSIKKWERRWKLMLIEESNPDWHDLYEVIC